MKVVLGMVQSIFSASAAEIGFRWDPLGFALSRTGLPFLRNLAGPVHHFKAAILDGVARLLLIFVAGKFSWWSFT